MPQHWGTGDWMERFGDGGSHSRARSGSEHDKRDSIRGDTAHRVIRHL
jgi:hypothetical protein